MSDTSCDKTVIISRAPGVCNQCGEPLLPYPDRPNLEHCPKCGTYKRTQETNTGNEIGNYQIIRKLGSGGMGQVFLCYALNNPEQLAAIKILYPGGGNDNADVLHRRFEKEARLSSLLVHPNIVRVYETGISSQNCYIAMEYVDGSDLDSIVKTQGPIAEELALNVAENLANALHYAWCEHKILHRDIKPANIMLNSRNEAKLMDFGIAKSHLDSPETTQLTMTNHCLGTPHYMSIEQAQDSRNVDIRSDIFSLGASLYFLLSATYPYPGNNLVEVVRNMLQSEPESLDLVNPLISRPCAKLIQVMMAPSPAERPADWGIVQEEIRRVKRGLLPLTERKITPRLSSESMQLALKMNYGGTMTNTTIVEKESGEAPKASLSERLRRGFFKRDNS